MTWAFSLSAECGSDRVAAEQSAKHIDGLSWILASGVESQCQTGIFADFEGN